MNPVTFPLKQAATGAAIADFHQALIALGYTIGAAELTNHPA